MDNIAEAMGGVPVEIVRRQVALLLPLRPELRHRRCDAHGAWRSPTCRGRRGGSNAPVKRHDGGD